MLDILRYLGLYIAVGLKVVPEDVGKVIGKEGRNVQAISVILGAAGMKLKQRFILEIIEKG